MKYVNYINEILRPNITEKQVVITFSAGCGGLSLGFRQQDIKRSATKWTRPQHGPIIVTLRATVLLLNLILILNIHQPNCNRRLLLANLLALAAIIVSRCKRRVPDFF